MASTSALILLLLPMAAVQEDPFASRARQEIERFVDQELWGHYDVQSVSVLEVHDHEGEWGHRHWNYGIRSVTARFRAERNAHWSEQLNPDLPADLCDTEALLYLLCRPTGYRFSGTLDLDMVFTVDGWKILSKHHRSLREYPLADYLDCQPDPRQPDRDAAIIRACFGGGG